MNRIAQQFGMTCQRVWYRLRVFLRNSLICVIRLIPKTSQSKINTDARGVCILKLDHIGDFVLCTGALDRIVSAYDQKEIYLICSPIAKVIADQRYPDINVIAVPPLAGFKEIFKAWRTIRRELSGLRFELIVSLRYQIDSYDALIIGQISYDRCVGTHIDGKKRMELMSDRVFTETVPYPCGEFSLTESQPNSSIPCHEIRCHADILTQALKKDVDWKHVIPYWSNARVEESDDNILIFPFGSTRIKDYPLARWGRLLSQLEREFDGEIILCSVPSDRHRLSKIAESMSPKTPSRVRLEYNLSIIELIDSISSARLIVSVDTGPAHIATCLDRDAVFILGGGHFGHFAPWRNSCRQVWITQRLDCFGCQWHCIRDSAECVTKISTDEILAEITCRLNDEL